MAENQNVSDTQGQPQVIRPASIPSAEAFGTPTIWLTYSFAPEWLNDALCEARTGRGHDARRREIVFAVCFAESYLVEWVRDQVLNQDLGRLSEFFPPGERRGVAEKWKDVPKALLDASLIKAVPDLGQLYWREWLKLVDMRNGLVHAKASRPHTGSQKSGDGPYPPKGDLDKLEPGWAARVVVKLVRELHSAVGIPTPVWLAEP